MSITGVDREANARAANWLEAWDGQGLHRTGTAGDQAGAEWLVREATALGAVCTVEEFELDRLDPLACFLEIAGQRVEGVPVFDAPATSADGVAGRVGPVGSGAEILVAELSPRAVYSGEFERLRQAGEHLGFVVVCRGDNPGLALINAEAFRRPYGAPALHVPTEAAPIIDAAVKQGASVRMVSASRRTRALARNVVVTLPGQNAATEAPVVVMTPRSSWWQSTAERGGGLVCWLESLRALLADPPRRPVIMTANTGHELGHLGLDDFVARRPGWDRAPGEGGATWVHYGANIGAAGGRLSVVAPQDGLRHLAFRELSGAGQSPDLAPKSLVPSGETRDIHKIGGHYLTLVGTNPLFHLPQDRWPHSVEVPEIARIAAASARVVLQMTR